MLILILSGFTISYSLFIIGNNISHKHKSAPKPETPICCKPAQNTVDTVSPCVFKAVFEGQYHDSDFMMATPENAKNAIDKALKWIAAEQLPDGSYYGGFHATQQILKDPNAKGDPATTALVAIAFYKSGSTPYQGPYKDHLLKAQGFLINAVESSKDQDANITTLTGTQPQIKLGANIDVSLTSQYLSNVLNEYANDSSMYNRIKKCIGKCVSKIQKNQNVNGSFSGAGWAGVLQSSISNNALESAKSVGVSVDSSVLEKSRNYQKSNYDNSKGQVSAVDGAGITLYAISSTSRASADEAGKAKALVKKAKKSGKIQSEDITVDNLVASGLSKTEAMKYEAAYNTNNAAAKIAQQDQVMSGFGNNGGEEYYSYLQTGESLYISRSDSWKTWYSNVIGRLVSLQQENGHWQGHHCITSPVFCTATCILILNGGK